MPKEIELAGTGVALGVLHVLTGPDHLSALATLSANVGSCPQAFVLGVRWGVGHSTGLLAVAVILIVLTRNNSQDDTIEVPDRATLVFESLVGTFMILLGAWGIRRALVKRSKIYDVVPTEIGDDNSCHEHQRDNEDRSSSLDFLASAEENPHCCGGQCIDHRDPEKGSAFDDTDPTDASSGEAGADDETDSVPTVQLGSCWRGFVDNISTRTLAFCAGIIHGLAGPGGILGVLPAVQLHDGWLASIFLGSFCLSSTLTMGVFATVYGTVTSRLVGQQGRLAENTRYREFLIELLSACLSILVGILWIALLSTGKLEDVFP